MFAASVVIPVQWAASLGIAAAFLFLGVCMLVTLLARDRARRAEDRATAAEAMLDARTRAFANWHIDHHSAQYLPEGLTKERT